MVAGGIVGTLSGVPTLPPATRIKAEQDKSFKDYYRGLYEAANTATAERVPSGSSPGEKGRDLLGAFYQ